MKLIRTILMPWIDKSIGRPGTISFKEWEAAVEMEDKLRDKVIQLAFELESLRAVVQEIVSGLQSGEIDNRQWIADTLKTALRQKHDARGNEKDNRTITE